MNCNNKILVHNIFIINNNNKSQCRFHLATKKKKIHYRSTN